MKNTHRVCKTHRLFTLIELLAVIAIIGALAMLILPRITNVEKMAKEGVDNYNAAGLFRAIETCFARGGELRSMHTGLNEDGTKTVRLATETDWVFIEKNEPAMPAIMNKNMEEKTETMPTDAVSKKLRRSLLTGGVKSLYYGSAGLNGATYDESFGFDVLNEAHPLRIVKGDWFNNKGDTILIQGYSLSINDYPGNKLVPLFVTGGTLRNTPLLGLTKEIGAKTADLVIQDFPYFAVIFLAKANGDPASVYGIITPDGQVFY